MRTLTLSLLMALPAVVACEDDDAGEGSPDAGSPDSGSPMDASLVTDGGLDASKPPTDGGFADGGKLVGTALVARGRYLVENIGVCGDCHTPRKADGSLDLTRALAGVDCFVDAVPDDPDAGCLPSRNLTNHETGLKNRSDQEIKDMILKGVRPDGKALFPTMPYYVLGNMRDEDANAIVAYLRQVPPVDHMVGPSQPPFLPPPAPAPRWPDDKIPRPRPDYPDGEAALRGRYLAGSIGVCMECHTARDENEAPVLDKAFQGGTEFVSALLELPPIFPALIHSANITPHATGIADWTVDDIVGAIKRGVDKDQPGAALCPPMPAGPMGGFGGITDEDARDIAHYLLSIAPGDNTIPEDCQATPPAPTGQSTR